MLFYVDRLFMSTGLRFCAFLCRYLRFSLSTCRHEFYAIMEWIFFYVVIFNPDVYSILMYILWLAKWYSILITYFTRIIDRAWTLRIYKYVIISGRYTAIKQWKLCIINKKMEKCPYIIGILIRHLIPSTLSKVKTKK